MSTCSCYNIYHEQITISVVLSSERKLKLRRIILRRSQQNRPRGEFQGQRPNNHRKGRGRRHPEGERQGPPHQKRRNRRRNPQAGHRNRDNRPPRRRNRQRSAEHPIREHFPHHNRMQEGFGGEVPFQRRRGRFRPIAGFTAYDDRFEIEVELPGVKEKDISVAVAGKRLIVKGKKHRKQSDENHNIRRSELKYGRFQRAFPLLPMANTEGIKADFKDGILTIVIPKKEEAKPKEIPINADT